MVSLIAQSNLQATAHNETLFEITNRMRVSFDQNCKKSTIHQNHVHEDESTNPQIIFTK
jgi:hypothetical protein